ncbi:hypothetical protein Hanom_Chr01g00079361 [Helianthus anomalus]
MSSFLLQTSSRTTFECCCYQTCKNGSRFTDHALIDPKCKEQHYKDLRVSLLKI